MQGFPAIHKFLFYIYLYMAWGSEIFSQAISLGLPLPKLYYYLNNSIRHRIV